MYSILNVRLFVRLKYVAAAFKQIKMSEYEWYFYISIVSFLLHNVTIKVQQIQYFENC